MQSFTEYFNKKLNEDVVPLSRAQLVKKINKIIAGVDVSGIHRDQHWEPINLLRQALETAGFDLVCQSSNYSHSESGETNGKTWIYEVPYGKKPVIVRITAAGAGSAENPLDAYDVVAYAS